MNARPVQSDFDLAELMLMDHFRAQTETLEKLTRWHVGLLDAGIPEAQAEALIALTALDMQEA